MRRQREDIIYFECPCCHAQYDDTRDEVYNAGSEWICEACMREDIGYRPYGCGTNWFFNEVVDALKIDHMTAVEWYLRNRNDLFGRERGL